MARRGPLLLAIAVLVPAAATTGSAVPAGTATDEHGCERPAPLFPGPTDELGVRVASAYVDVTQWYEHEPEGTEATYTLAPVVGEVQLEAFTACDEPSVCSPEPATVGETARCTVEEDRLLLAVTGTEAPHRSLGVTFAIHHDGSGSG